MHGILVPIQAHEHHLERLVLGLRPIVERRQLGRVRAAGAVKVTESQIVSEQPATADTHSSHGLL